MGNTVRFRRAFGGPTDRHQPEPKRLDWDDAGQGYLYLILPQRRLVSNEFPCEIRAWITIDRPVAVRSSFQSGLGESRTPTPFRTSAPKTDASAIPPRGLYFWSVSESVVRYSRHLLPRGRRPELPVKLATVYLAIECYPRNIRCKRRAIVRRRRFLAGSGFGLAALLGAASGKARAMMARGAAPREIAADVVIVGGGLGGCAAALAVLRSGHTARAHRGDRLDRRPAHVAGCASGRASLDRAIRRLGFVPEAAERDPRFLSTALSPDREARANERLNPGNGAVSALCHEPRAALAALTSMLAPYASSGRLLIAARARA